MAYEYEEFIEAMRFGLTMSDRDTTDDIWKMVDEVVNKAKAFDEIAEVYSDNNLYSDEYVFETIQEQIDELERADDER